MFGTYKVKIDNEVVGIIKIYNEIKSKIILKKEENKFLLLLKNKHYEELNNLIFDYLTMMINDPNLRDNYKKILELTRDIDTNKDNYMKIYNTLKESNLL